MNHIGLEETLSGYPIAKELRAGVLRLKCVIQTVYSAKLRK